MHNTVLNIQNDIFTELEKIQLEHAAPVDHSGEVCSFCGGRNEVSIKEMSSITLEKTIKLPICSSCSAGAEGQKVEQFLSGVEMSDQTHWTKIIINNMRKNDWVSKIVFSQLLGGLKEEK